MIPQNGLSAAVKEPQFSQVIPVSVASPYALPHPGKDTIFRRRHRLRVE